MKLLIGASGASGMILTHTLLSELRSNRSLPFNIDVTIISTKTANLISKEEVGHDFTQTHVKSASDRFHYYSDDSFYAPSASGSTFDFDTTIIIPCSMGFAARVANGISSTLLERSFDVAVKENKKIIIVPREMPFSIIHLENLTKLAKLGVIVCPACPSYYGHPSTIQNVTDNIVGKVLKLAGIENNLYKKWKI